MRVPRPVAGLPQIDPQELAKAWLLGLLDARELARAADVPVAQLAAAGPAVAAALLDALASDAALDGLPDAGAHVGALAGAGDAAEALAAVEALRAAAAAALRAARPADAVLADALDRLAYAAHVLAGVAVGACTGAPEPEIHAHDHRDTPAAVLGRALERHAEDGEPFALLVGEVADLERWAAAAPDAIAAAAAAVAAALRPGDRLVPEEPGRWWIVAPGTDDAAARELAAALADAAEHAGPAGVAFGIAGCPHDGVDAEALGAHADEALLRARAAGLPVA